MAGAADDLDLLLSLDEDGETPPSSPHPADGAITPPRIVRHGGTDMSVFREAVKDYIEATPASTTSPVLKRPKPPPPPPKPTQTIVDSYSGLLIKNLTVSPLETTNRFADIRFVRISAIKYGSFLQISPLLSSVRCSGLMGGGGWFLVDRNLAGSDSFSGCWATAGVVLDKGVTRVSAQGKDYSIWKMGALVESEVRCRCSCSGTRTPTTPARCSRCLTAMSAWIMGERVLLECCLSWADDDDGDLRRIRDLQREEEGWDGLHHGHKQA